MVCFQILKAFLRLLTFVLCYSYASLVSLRHQSFTFELMDLFGLLGYYPFGAKKHVLPLGCIFSTDFLKSNML